MFDSVFLDIGIGVAVVFFLAASVVSAFNEWVTRLLDIRAKVLWKALSNALDGNTTAPFVITLREAFSGFFSSDTRPSIISGGGTGAEAAADVESASLTGLLANTNMVRALGGETWLRKKSRTKVDAIAGSTFSSALLAAADQAADRKAIKDPGESDIVKELQRLTKGTAVGEVVEAATFTDAPTLDSIAAAITTWFDAHMARVSELYKIAARKVLFVVGLALAVVLNLSAIDLVDDLKNNSNARTALAAGVDASCEGAVLADCRDHLLRIVTSDTAQISLPVVGEWTNPLTSLKNGGTADDPDGRLELIVGWFISGFAVSFGAPFWFDVVQKLSASQNAAA